MLEQPQWLRLIEVLVIGPYMIRSAATVRSPLVRSSLVIAATAAIAFNAADWLANYPERGFFGERKRGDRAESDLARVPCPGAFRNPRRLA